VGAASILIVVKLLLLLSWVLGVRVVVEVLALQHTVTKVLGDGEGRAGGVSWAAPPLKYKAAASIIKAENDSEEFPGLPFVASDAFAEAWSAADYRGLLRNTDIYVGGEDVEYLSYCLK
jgi:hypothetical protein